MKDVAKCISLFSSLRLTFNCNLTNSLHYSSRILEEIDGVENPPKWIMNYYRLTKSLNCSTNITVLHSYQICQVLNKFKQYV